MLGLLYIDSLEPSLLVLNFCGLGFSCPKRRDLPTIGIKRKTLEFLPKNKDSILYLFVKIHSILYRADPASTHQKDPLSPFIRT